MDGGGRGGGGHQHEEVMPTTRPGVTTRLSLAEYCPWYLALPHIATQPMLLITPTSLPVPPNALSQLDDQTLKKSTPLLSPLLSHHSPVTAWLYM